MRVLRSARARVLDDRDADAARRVLAGDPAANVFVASRVDCSGLDPARLGGQLWGYHVDGELTALCYSGANLVPVGADEPALLAFADKARRQGRRCSSIVGPAAMVGPLWRLLAPLWGPARDVRPDQPLMAAARASRVVRPDPAVRRVRPDELELLLPACVAMFTEEVGVSPLAAGGGPLYRARVAELVQQGRAFARIEDGTVVFKAEIGAVSPVACQVQGVWVRPDRRGTGLSVAGMAAVLAEALASFAPLVTLYVNRWNTPALRAYRTVGFREVGAFASVLF
jgi:predicted GNAT family acetyltransferase